MPAKRMHPLKKISVGAGYATSDKKHSKITCIDLIRPYRCIMDPPKIMAAKKFAELRYVVILDNMLVDD